MKPEKGIAPLIFIIIVAVLLAVAGGGYVLISKKRVAGPPTPASPSEGLEVTPTSTVESSPEKEDGQTASRVYLPEGYTIFSLQHGNVRIKFSGPKDWEWQEKYRDWEPTLKGEFCGLISPPSIGGCIGMYIGTITDGNSAKTEAEKIYQQLKRPSALLQEITIGDKKGFLVSFEGQRTGREGEMFEITEDAFVFDRAQKDLYITVRFMVDTKFKNTIRPVFQTVIGTMTFEAAPPLMASACLPQAGVSL